MSRIESLTPEQTAAIPGWVERWVKVGVSCEPADRVAAEEGVRLAYLRAGLEPPKTVVWLRSPLEGAVAAAMLAQVSGPVGDQVWTQVGGQVRGQVWAQVGDQVFRALYGLHDAGWLSFYDTCAQWRIKGCETLAPIMQVAQEMGWWWPFQGACILTHRPTVLCRDERGRLHSGTGPAVDYDGTWGVWAWHGVRVAQDMIEQPELIRGQRVLAEPNAELRRVMLEIMGTERFFQEVQPQVIHHDLDGPGHPRRLLKIALPNDPEGSMVGVEVVDPSTGRQYILRVRPDVKTCAEAVASTFPGLPAGARYTPDVEA